MKHAGPPFVDTPASMHFQLVVGDSLHSFSVHMRSRDGWMYGRLIISCLANVTCVLVASLVSMKCMSG